MYNCYCQKKFMNTITRNIHAATSDQAVTSHIRTCNSRFYSRCSRWWHPSLKRSVLDEQDRGESWVTSAETIYWKVMYQCCICSHRRSAQDGGPEQFMLFAKGLILINQNEELAKGWRIFFLNIKKNSKYSFHWWGGILASRIKPNQFSFFKEFSINVYTQNYYNVFLHYKGKQNMLIYT